MLKHLLLPALLLITSIAFAGEPNTLTDKEKADGWKLLFDGKTTEGWVAIGQTAFPKSGWAVVDGALHHTKGGGGGDIVTTETFSDFELTWEWKIGEAGNSGVKWNLPDPKKGVGFEYQMLDDAKHPDGIKGGGLHRTGSLYDLIAPPEDKKLNPVGEWNSSRIVVNGAHAEHWLNGAKTVEFERGSEALKELIAKSKYKNVPGFGEKTASPILIQDHGDEVTVRSIKIRVLPTK